MFFTIKISLHFLLTNNTSSKTTQKIYEKPFFPVNGYPIHLKALGQLSRKERQGHFLDESRAESENSEFFKSQENFRMILIRR